MARLLYVEDDALLRTVTAMALDDAGYEVVEAHDGRQALQLLSDQGGFDYVVSDISMPGGVSGLEVARAAQQVRPGCRAIPGIRLRRGAAASAPRCGRPWASRSACTS